MIAGSVSHYNFGVQKIGFMSVESPYWTDPFFDSAEKYSSIKRELYSGLILTGDNQNIHNTFYSLESFKWSIIKTLLTLVIVCGYLLTFKTKNAKIISLLLLLWLNHIVISCVFGEPLPRYVMQIMPITFLLSTVIFFEILNYLKKENARADKIWGLEARLD